MVIFGYSGELDRAERRKKLEEKQKRLAGSGPLKEVAVGGEVSLS
jgi:hypothetical protein